MKCMHCGGNCIKSGRQRNGSQKVRCKTCRKYQLTAYRNEALKAGMDHAIQSLLTEGIGMRGIARVLHISLTTVISRIRRLAKLIAKPSMNMSGRVIELDELWTFVKRKMDETWIIYAIDRDSKEVVDFRLGSRSGYEIGPIIAMMIDRQVRRICTDGLNVYKGLVPERLHKVGSFYTQSIERFNLNLRTHLKRLSRKTICFSKSNEMLEACLKVYFWRRAAQRCVPMLSLSNGYPHNY